MRRASTALVAGAVLSAALAVPAAAEPGEEPLEDLTPPDLVVTPPAGGVDRWYAGDVAIGVRATDNHANASGIRMVSWAMSGAQTATGNFGNRVGVGTVTVVNTGVTTVDIEASDGNDNHTFNQTVVGIDRVPPAVTLPAGLHGAELVEGTQFVATYSCADAHSGIVSCTGPVASGGNVDTSALGHNFFTVTARDKVGRTTSATATFTVVDNVFTFTHAPAIEGTAAVGQLLTVRAPVVAPQPTALTYTWRRNGVVVATGSSYRVVEADGGSDLTVVAEARRPGVTPKDLVSAPRSVPIGTIQLSSDPVMAGEPRVGQLLEVQRGSSSASQTTFVYEWLRDGDVVQSSGQDFYWLEDADIGHRITARLVASAPGYSTRAWDVGPAVTVQGRQLEVSGSVQVTGTPLVGSMLTAQPPSITVPLPSRARAGVTIAYQWLREGSPVAGATAATYLLGPADAGRRVSVLVTGSAPGYETERRASALGGPVAAATPVLTAKAKALGNKRVRVTVQVGGVNGVVPAGTVTVNRRAKRVGGGTLTEGMLVLTLRKQRPGKVTYTVTYAGTAGIEAGTVTAKVKVR